MFQKVKISHTIILNLLVCLMILSSYLMGVSLGFDFSRWGIRPGSHDSVLGILQSPLAHANMEHLLSNVSSLFIVLLFLGVFYTRIFIQVLSLSWLLTGLVLFLFARNQFAHIGASGVVYAVTGFLIFTGFWTGNAARKTVAMILILFYGSMFWGLFPLDPKVSWDGHLSGLSVGLILSLLFMKKNRKEFRPVLPEWYKIPENDADPYLVFEENIKQNPERTK